MVVDLFKPEDNWGMADIAYAVTPNFGEILLLQMDGNVTKKEFLEGKKMADEAIQKVYKMQVDVLKERYMEGSE